MLLEEGSALLFSESGQRTAESDLSRVKKRGMMQSKKKTLKQPRRRRFLAPILILLLLVGAGAGGYWYWNRSQSALSASTAASSAPKTSTVRNGSITLSASGSGTLSASQQNALGFSTSGNVAVLNVKVGDTVKKDAVLAQLDNLDTLQTSLSLAQQNLATAQAALQTLKDSGATNLASAQLALATAQKAYIDAQSAVVQKDMARCDQATIDVDYQKYLLAVKALDKISAGGSGNDYYLTYVVPAKDKLAQAYSVYIWCTGFTNYEIDSTNAKVSLTKAQLAAAQSTLDTLQKNDGVDPVQLATAQNGVASAQLALNKAQKILDGATIKAPYDGTILALTGQLGDAAGTAAFITIADLAHPQISFSVDEADLSKVSIGAKVSVSFDAITNRTFTAIVTQINPSLVNSGGYKVIQGTALLDLSAEKDIPVMPSGMNATIQVISGEAKDVPLVPVQALRDLGNGQYAVFVMTNGQPRLRTITIGIMDTVNAEVKSGLQAGDVVTTGVAQVTTNTTSGTGSGN